MTLTSVVLPAPLGPIRPWIDPCATSSDTPSTARTPPKCRWTSSRRSSTDSGSRPPRRPHDGQTAAAHDSLRPEDDDRDEEGAAENVDVIPGAREDVGEQRDHECSHHRAENESAAAKNRKREDLHRTRDAVLRVARFDEEVQVRLDRPGVAGDKSAEDERDHLVARDVDALAHRGDLVLPDP